MKVTYYVATSIDGFIADSAGRVDWLRAVEAEDEDYGYGAFLDTVDGLVMGRRTFEDVLSFGPWPYGDRPSRVFTHRLPREDDEGPRLPAQLTDAPIGDVLRDLESERVRHLWLVGGGVLASRFLEAGFLTDLVVSVAPVLLGTGTPLFSEPTSERSLQLIDSRSYPTGLVQSIYRPMRSG